MKTWKLVLAIGLLIFVASISRLYHIVTPHKPFIHNEDYEDIDFLTRKFNPSDLLSPKKTVKYVTKKVLIKVHRVDTVFIDTSREKVKIIEKLLPFDKLRLVSLKGNSIELYEFDPQDSVVLRKSFYLRNPWNYSFMIYKTPDGYRVASSRFHFLMKPRMVLGWSFPNDYYLKIQEDLFIQDRIVISGYAGIYKYPTSIDVRAGIEISLFLK